MAAYLTKYRSTQYRRLMLQNLTKLGRNFLKPSAITKKEKNWLILARLGDKKQTRQGGGGWYVKYNALYSNKNDDNPNEICSGFIKLSIDFHPIAIISRK